MIAVIMMTLFFSYLLRFSAMELKKRLILRLLHESNQPMTSIDLAGAISAAGNRISQRSVRLYLRDLADQQLITRHGRRGVTISQTGRQIVRTAHLARNIGFFSAKIDRMTYAMTFNPDTAKGTVIANLSIIRTDWLTRNAKDIAKVFECGYAMGKKLALIPAGQQVAGHTIPENHYALITVCSITVNGILLKAGIPTRSRFGGLLAIANHQPDRLVELIDYDGTTVNPLLAFIRGGMTDYRGAIATGNGRIGISFRELPADARTRILDLCNTLNAMGLGCLIDLGFSGQSLREVPVSIDRIGAIFAGGLNPVAILEEQALHTHSDAMCLLFPYERLNDYTQLQHL